MTMGEQLAMLGMAVGKALMPFVVTLAGTLIAQGVLWLKAHTKNASIKGIEERLGNLALTVVQETEQTVVSTLPSSPTASDYLHAKQAALASLRLHLGTNGIDEIKKVMGWDDTSLELVLESYIESKVHVVKRASGVPLQPLKAVQAGGVS
jgi:ABC-type xylose transport system permease subunit